MMTRRYVDGLSVQDCRHESCQLPQLLNHRTNAAWEFTTVGRLEIMDITLDLEYANCRDFPSSIPSFVLWGRQVDGAGLRL